MNMKVMAYLDRLNKLEKNLQKPDLRSAGNAAIADIHRNFDTKGTNINQPWKPLSGFPVLPDPRKATEGNTQPGKRKKLKIRTGEPLKFKGHLYRSVHQKQSGNTLYVIASKTTKNTRTGETVNLTWVQNFGAKIRVTPKMRAFLHAHGIHLREETTHIEIPARPFMAFSDGGYVEIKDLIREAVMP